MANKTKTHRKDTKVYITGTNGKVIIVAEEELARLSKSLGGYAVEIVAHRQDTCTHEWAEVEGTHEMMQTYENETEWIIGTPPPNIKPVIFYAWDGFCSKCKKLDALECYVRNWASDGTMVELMYVENKREELVHSVHSFKIVGDDVENKPSGVATFLVLEEEISRTKLEVDDEGDLIIPPMETEDDI